MVRRCSSAERHVPCLFQRRGDGRASSSSCSCAVPAKSARGWKVRLFQRLRAAHTGLIQHRGTELAVLAARGIGERFIPIQPFQRLIFAQARRPRWKWRDTAQVKNIELLHVQDGGLGAKRSFL